LPGGEFLSARFFGFASFFAAEKQSCGNDRYQDNCEMSHWPSPFNPPFIILFDSLRIAGDPGLVEPRFQRAIQPEDQPEAFAGYSVKKREVCLT
jgi:hypothetical protein